MNAHRNIRIARWRVALAVVTVGALAVAVGAALGATSKSNAVTITALIGSSGPAETFAVNNAITKAAQTMRNMHWFQITDTRGQIVDGKVAWWQVTLKIGFTLED